MLLHKQQFGVLFDTKIVKAFCVDDGNIDWDT